MKNLKTLLLLVLMVPAVAMAQVPRHGGVNHRQGDQHRRIEQGVHHGSLTKREATRLRKREAAIRVRERRDRKLHHGRLTIGELHRLNRAQGRADHRIFKQKHNNSHRP